MIGRAAAPLALVLLAGAAHGQATPAPEPRAPEPTTETWVGHQVTLGRREIPVMGTLETRTDTWVVAEVRRVDAATLELTERACRVQIAEAAGARITMTDATVRALPATTVRYALHPRTGLWQAGPWKAGWDRRDHDGDGHPGITITVDAPLCGGRLHVASESQSIARARWEGPRFSGELKVKLAQTILGAEGKCLGVVSSDSDERLTGHLAYARVEPGATCEALARAGWLERRWAEAPRGAEPAR